MKQLCEYSRRCFYDSHLDIEACENEERRCCEPIKATNQRKKKPFPSARTTLTRLGPKLTKSSKWHKASGTFSCERIILNRVCSFTAEKKARRAENQRLFFFMKWRRFQPAGHCGTAISLTVAPLDNNPLGANLEAIFPERLTVNGQ